MVFSLTLLQLFFFIEDCLLNNLNNFDQKHDYQHP